MTLTKLMDDAWQQYRHWEMRSEPVDVDRVYLHDILPRDRLRYVCDTGVFFEAYRSHRGMESHGFEMDHANRTARLFGIPVLLTATQDTPLTLMGEVR